MEKESSYPLHMRVFLSKESRELLSSILLMATMNGCETFDARS